MKRAIINALKIAVPLGIGVWLIYSQYVDLKEKGKLQELIDAFRAADLSWLYLATVIGWLAHVSRAWRWRYLLEPLGHKPGFWNSYHAVMIGYFMNMFLPRAGEASRGASLYATEKVPFEKGFGTIMAERAIDMLVLLLIVGIALSLQVDKLDMLRTNVARFRSENAQTASGFPWGIAIMGLLVVGALVLVFLAYKRPALRARLMDLVRGFLQGLQAVFRTKHKQAFVLHTVLIWGAYLGMFQLGFYCLPTMAAVPFAGVLAGFIAGAISIVLVQGGIGVYPAFVALIVGIYLGPGADGALIRPDALAMGWLLWAAQTLMIIALGGVSLLLTSFKKPS